YTPRPVIARVPSSITTKVTGIAFRNIQLGRFAEEQGLTLVGGIAASAPPSAPIQQADYERLREDVLDRLGETPDVRAVVLTLHGAMVSTDCEDCEGDLLKRMREHLGPDVPIGAVLDPHAHLTDAMVDHADVLIFMKEYPHTDGKERMAELLDLLARRIRGEIQLIPAVVDCCLLGFFPTTDDPMRRFVDGLSEMEHRPEILSVSFVHGFPWGDTSETGAKMLVYCDGDAHVALETAQQLKTRLWEIAAELEPQFTALEDAIAACRKSRDGPLVLADIADNPGGGAPSDSTFVLEAMLDAGVEDAAIGLLFDPMAVKLCHQVGPGGHLKLRIGGKISPFSGQPLDLDVDVMDVRESARMQVIEGVSFPMGDTAWVRTRGIDIVLSSERLQMYAPDGFAHIGLDPAERNVLVVKSSNHFRAFFGEMVNEIIDVTTPGAIHFSFRDIPYKKLVRPVHPLQWVDGLSERFEAVAPLGSADA
ncbi:MAG: M81 family metallopeptidase, partial [Pseudomonadota bacterium]